MKILRILQRVGSLCGRALPQMPSVNRSIRFKTRSYQLCWSGL